MKAGKVLLALLSVLGFSCAEVRRGPFGDAASARAVPAYSLSVRTDDPALEAFLVQRGREVFGPLLPLGDGGGKLVVRFSARTPRASASLSLGLSSSVPPAAGPMTPSPPVALPGAPEPQRRTWVDADLLVRLEDGEGRVLYGASASVRGRRHLVEDPRRAAEICLEKVARDLSAFLGERRERPPGASQGGG